MSVKVDTQILVVLLAHSLYLFFYTKKYFMYLLSGFSFMGLHFIRKKQQNPVIMITTLSAIIIATKDPSIEPSVFRENVPSTTKTDGFTDPSISVVKS